MTAFALISGRLQGAPSTRPTKTGGQVTFFTLRVANGATTEFWDVATFSDLDHGLSRRRCDRRL